MGIVLTEAHNKDDTASSWIRPIDSIEWTPKLDHNDKVIVGVIMPKEATAVNFEALISEATGTFVIVLMSMIIMNKK